MDFELSEEQGAFKKSVRKFAERELAPNVGEWYRTEQYPIREVAKKMAAFGILGQTIPEEYGGSGADVITNVLTLGEISRVCFVSAQILLINNGAGSSMIIRYGTESQKKRFLPPMTKGEKIGAFALTEPDAGSDSAGIRTSAIRDGDNYIINGSKIFITIEDEENTICNLMVKTDKEKGTKGVSVFVVESGTPGFSIGKKTPIMGSLLFGTHELVFDDLRLSKENLLGKEGEGLKQALKALNTQRVYQPTLSLGIAEGCFETALSYVVQRKQFGKRIIDFQGIQWMLAEMATQIEAARLLIYQAAMKMDGGLPSIKEASMCKFFGNEMAMKVSTDAIQLMGASGCSWDYPVEAMMRRSKTLCIGAGTVQIQKILIARELIKEAEKRWA